MDAPPVIPAAPGSRERSMLWGWLAVPLVGIAAVLFWFNPSHYSFYPRCALYVSTGIYCPGCGTQRCLHELLHGNILAALRNNALVVLAIPFGIFYAARWMSCWVNHRPMPRFRLRSYQIVLLVAGLILFTVLRNIHTAPFIYLAPL